MILARNESFFYQAIDGHTDGSGSEPNFRTDGIHREWTFIEEDFQDAEVGVAQFCPLNAPGRVGEQGLKSFHKNEPDMHAGGVLLLGFASSFH